MSPLVLIILDGFGLSPTLEGNAVLGGQTPNFDQLLSYFPHSSLHASGQEVGLGWGEIGNSEVGHLNLGTGRISMQDLPRIDKTIQDGSFFTNKELLEAYVRAASKQSNLHLIGLVSAGGVHSHINHLLALLDLAYKMKVSKVYVHMISDGRDTPQKAALNDLKTLENKFNQIGLGKVASVMGRYFAMDRDKHWDRIQKAYDVMTDESSPKANSSAEAIQNSYNSGKTDEFIEPVMIEGTPRVQDGDEIIFFNYRSDRSKQISASIINQDFKDFPRKKVLQDFYFVSFTSYGHEPSPQVKVAFFAEKVISPLAQIIADNKLKQLHIAETEKYAHVTYFFNAGIENPLIGEERILIPSPKVATYDLAPEMSAEQVASKFIEYFLANKPYFSVINFANPDMVGHTGSYEATVKAVSTVDSQLGKVTNAVLSAGGNLIITADHGNAEQMTNLQTKEIDTEHTTNPVPVILATGNLRRRQPLSVDQNYKINLASMNASGVLADVTATCINLLGLPQPQVITGQNLIGIIS